MTTITDFLLARIAEDEAVAERGGRHNAQSIYANDNYGCLLVAPARVLAECEAKRRIVERYAYLTEYGDDGGARWVLPLLALPHADHPDYDETWRPLISDE